MIRERRLEGKANAAGQGGCPAVSMSSGPEERGGYLVQAIGQGTDTDTERWYIGVCRDKREARLKEPFGVETLRLRQVSTTVPQ